MAGSGRGVGEGAGWGVARDGEEETETGELRARYEGACRGGTDAQERTNNKSKSQHDNLLHIRRLRSLRCLAEEAI